MLVATLRALKVHGGARVKRAGEPDAAALERGLEHLEKHLETAAFFGLPVVVAINVFPTDTADELALVDEAARRRGVRAVRCEGFARGGEGALDLARAVVETADATDAAPPAPRYVYDLAEPIPREDPRRSPASSTAPTDVVFAGSAAQGHEADRGARLRRPARVHGEDPALAHRRSRPCPADPRGFTVTVREVRLSAGAGFVVPLTGDMMTMPGLPREPAALRVKLLPDGRIRGLMQNDD